MIAYILFNLGDILKSFLMLHCLLFVSIFYGLPSMSFSRLDGESRSVFSSLKIFVYRAEFPFFRLGYVLDTIRYRLIFG